NVWKSEAHKMKPAPSDVSAQTVIDHYIKAIGGKKALQNVNDITYQLSTQSQGYRVNITEMKKRPDKFSLVVKVPAIGRTVESIKVNGNSVHQTNANGQEVNLTKAQKEGYKKSAIIFPELKYLAGNYQTKLAGIKNDDGSKV